MGERKVLNKYIPHDFDPTLVPRGKRPKDGMVTVRMMLPFSVQCQTCSEFLYRGRKFNSKKENVSGSDGKYLGIQRYRFYIKCTACSSPITFLTDPKNADYEMESGATRNYEVYKDEKKTNIEAEINIQEEEKIDPTKALENRVLQSQQEIADIDNLEMILAMNKKHQQLKTRKMKNSKDNKDGISSSAADVEAILMARDNKEKRREEANNKDDVNVILNENGLTESEEAMIKTIKFGTNSQNNVSKIATNDDNNNNNNLLTIKRLNEDDEKAIEEKRKQNELNLQKQQNDILNRTNNSSLTTSSSLPPIIKVKKKKIIKKRKLQEENNNNDTTTTTTSSPKVVKKINSTTNNENNTDEKSNHENKNNNSLGDLLGAYDSDSD